MLTLDLLAEQRIREAQERGEFDNLPGAGAPLALDDDALVPEELRAAYRILKNAGYVPPELEIALRNPQNWSSCCRKSKTTAGAAPCSPASISCWRAAPPADAAATCASSRVTSGQPPEKFGDRR